MIRWFLRGLFACVASMHVACGVAFAQTVCFTSDGETVIGKPRPLPVQGWDGEEVVVGLPVRPVADWIRCGYWPYVQGERPQPVSNETYRVSGYVLDKPALVARPVWQAVVPRVRPVDYSKRLLYRAIKERGAWEQVKSWMVAQGVWEDWEYATTLEATDPLMVSAIPALQQMLGFTDEEMQEVLKSCIAK